MYGKESYWKMFYEKLDSVVSKTLDKNVIIYGSAEGGEFLRWFYLKFYGKKIKCVVDRWQNDSHFQILHLMSFYYLWEENDIIINTLPSELGPEIAFRDIGEDWSRVKYSDTQIIPLWDKLYREKKLSTEENYRQITFYDWLEYVKEVDLVTTIRRNAVRGKEAHGYYPTDFRLIYEAFADGHFFDKNCAILDFGCGKGASMIALSECGYTKIGGVEYTEEIYQILLSNIQKAGGQAIETSVLNQDSQIETGKFTCFLGDASKLEKQIDLYQQFFIFNPFSWSCTEEVFQHIFESCDRQPRKIKIFYAEPMCHNLLINSGKFFLAETLKGSIGGITYYANLYESK